MNFFAKLAVGAALGFLVLRGGAGALIGLVKAGAPLLIGYIGYRGLKNVLFKSLQPPDGPRDGASPQDTIEICPDCGHEKGPRHRCSKG